MKKQQLCLSGLVFSVHEDSAYSSLTHNLKTGWSSADGLKRPFSYLSSTPLRALSLSGEVLGVDGAEVLGAMYKKALEPEPHQLSDELGNDLGFWVVKAVKETQSSIIDDGSAHVRKFDLTLEEFVDA